MSIFDDLKDAVSGAVSTVTHVGDPSKAVHQVTSGVGGVLGDVGDVGSSAARFAGLGGALDRLGDAIRPMIRSAALVANAPYQVVQGTQRNVASDLAKGVHGDLLAGARGLSGLTPLATLTELPRPETWEQTDIGQVGGAALKGKPIDVGSGYLPDVKSEVVKAQAQAARDQSPYLIGGHAFTLGRAAAQPLEHVPVAGKIFEPDQTGFNILSGAVDFAAAMKADPVMVLGKDLAAARQEAKTFSATDAGAHTLFGHVWLHPTTVDAFKNSAEETRLVEGLAAESSPMKILRQTNWEKTGFPVQTPDGAEFIKTIAGSTDPEEIRTELQKWYGAMEQRPSMAGGFKYQVAKGLGLGPRAGGRLTAMMPESTFVDTNDMNHVVSQMDKYGRWAGMSEETRNAMLDQYIRADQADGGYRAMDTMTDFFRQHLQSMGVPEDKAKRMMTIARDGYDEFRKYNQEAIGKEAWSPGSIVLDNGQVLPHPVNEAQQLSHGFFMPDPKELAREVSKFRDILGSPVITVPSTILESLTNTWKYIHMLKAGLTARIGGDAQLAMGTSGLDALGNHAGNWLSYVLGTRGEGGLGGVLRKAGSVLPGVEPKPPPEAFADLVRQHDPETMRAMQRPFAGVFGSQDRGALRDYVSLDTGHEQGPRAVAEKLIQLNSDEVSRRLAGAQSPEDAYRLFMSDEMAVPRRRLQQWAEVENRVGPQEILKHPGATFDPVDLTTEAGIKQYLETRILNPIKKLTANGDSRLLSGITEGKVDGVSLTDPLKPGARNEAVAKLKALRDDPEAPFPKDIEARRVLVNPELAASRAKGLNYLLSQAFHGLVTLPDRNLNRIPAWEQSYWDNVIKHVPYASDSARAATLKDAEKSLDPDRLAKLRANAALPVPEGQTPLNRNTLITLAKHSAAEELTKVTHDISQRSYAFNAGRFLFPFGDAFRRIASRWSQIAWEHPEMFHRVDQAVRSARSSGFFHTDPTTGQEVFTIPGSELITEKTMGVPIPLHSEVKGLSLLGNFYPGVGYAASIPASYLLPDKPRWDWASKLLFPYGRSSVQGQNIEQTAGSAFIPPFLNKFATGMDANNDPASWAKTNGSMIKYLASTGDYDLHGPNAAEETNRLLKDAKEKSKFFYMIRGAFQFGFPAPPTPDFQAYDVSGRLHAVSLITQQYAKDVADKNKGPDIAMDNLIKLYGDNPFLAQSSTKSVVHGVPTSDEGLAWVNDHQDLVKKYPATYGYFAPQGGKFSLSSYDNQVASGARKVLSPEDQVAEANNRLGMHLFHKMTDVVHQSNGGKAGRETAAQRIALGEVQQVLEERFPGFKTVAHDENLANRQRKELMQAAKDKTIKGPVADALRAYLTARDQAIGVSNRKYHVTTPFSSSRTVLLREGLRSIGEDLVKQVPDFQTMWDDVWDREMKQDSSADIILGGRSGA